MRISGNVKRLQGAFERLNDELADKGIEAGFGITSIYQTNVKDGTSTRTHRGRHHGRYEATMDIDLEKLLGIEGGSFSIVGWGGWPDEKGIDGHSAGSAWGINALPYGNRGMDIVECFYEGPSFSSALTIAIGKIDFTAVFDAAAYADDECSQFVNAALVDDPTIPFPEQSLGVVLRTCKKIIFHIWPAAASAGCVSRTRTTGQQACVLLPCQPCPGSDKNET